MCVCVCVWLFCLKFKTKQKKQQKDYPTQYATLPDSFNLKIMVFFFFTVMPSTVLEILGITLCSSLYKLIPHSPLATKTFTPDFPPGIFLLVWKCQPSHQHRSFATYTSFHQQLSLCLIYVLFNISRYENIIQYRQATDTYITVVTLQIFLISEALWHVHQVSISVSVPPSFCTATHFDASRQSKLVTLLPE